MSFLVTRGFLNGVSTAPLVTAGFSTGAVSTYRSYISAEMALVDVVKDEEVLRQKANGDGEFKNWVSAQGRDLIRYAMLQG